MASTPVQNHIKDSSQTNLKCQTILAIILVLLMTFLSSFVSHTCNEILLKQRSEYLKHNSIWFTALSIYSGCIIGGVIADLLIGRFNTLMVAFLCQCLGVLLFFIPILPNYDGDVLLIPTCIFLAFSNGFSRMNLIIVLIQQLPLKKCIKDSKLVIESGNISCFFILFLLTRDTGQGLAQLLAFYYRLQTPFVMITFSVFTFYVAAMSYPVLYLQSVKDHFKFTNCFGDDQYECETDCKQCLQIPNLEIVTSAPEFRQKMRILQFKILFKWFVWLAAYCTFFGILQNTMAAIYYTNLSSGQDMSKWTWNFSRYYVFLPNVPILAIYALLTIFKLNRKLTPHYLLGISYIMLMVVLAIASILETRFKVKPFNIDFKDNLLLWLLYMTMDLSLTAAYEVIYRKSQIYATALTIGFFEFSTVFGTLMGTVLYNFITNTSFSDTGASSANIENCPERNDDKKWVQPNDCGHLENYFLLLYGLSIATFAIFYGFTLFNIHYYKNNREQYHENICRQISRKLQRQISANSAQCNEQNE